MPVSSQTGDKARAIAASSVVEESGWIHAHRDTFTNEWSEMPLYVQWGLTVCPAGTERAPPKKGEIEGWGTTQRQQHSWPLCEAVPRILPPVANSHLSRGTPNYDAWKFIFRSRLCTGYHVKLLTNVNSFKLLTILQGRCIPLVTQDTWWGSDLLPWTVSSWVCEGNG